MTGVRLFDKTELDDLGPFLDRLIAGPGYDRAAVLHDCTGLFEAWKEFRPPAANSRTTALDEAEEFGTGDRLAEEAAESGDWERSRWVYASVEYDEEHEVLLAVSIDIRHADGSQELWQDLYRNANDAAETAATYRRYHPEDYADPAAPADDDPGWQQAGGDDELGPPPDVPVPPVPYASSDDGEYAYAAEGADLWLFPIADLDRLVADYERNPDGFGQTVVGRGGYVEYVGDDAPGRPTAGAGRLQLQGGIVTGWEQVISDHGQAPGHDPDAAYTISLGALRGIVADRAAGPARTTTLTYGNGEVLLGEHGWPSVQAVGGATGTVTFKANRTSANELVVDGVTVDDRLRTILRSMVKDPAVAYGYRDIDRVVVR